MKICSLILAVLLLFGFAYAQQPKPQPVEYNIGFCGGQHFFAMHIVLSADEKSLDFSHYMTGPDEVTKAEGDGHLIFPVKVEPKDKDGIRKFSGSTKFNGNILDINGDIKEGRIVALQKINGELGHALYGEIGTVDGLIKVAPDAFQTCMDLHAIPIEEIPQALAKYLNTKPPDKTQ
jgi:hypothetical protein